MCKHMQQLTTHLWLSHLNRCWCLEAEPSSLYSTKLPPAITRSASIYMVFSSISDTPRTDCMSIGVLIQLASLFPYVGTCRFVTGWPPAASPALPARVNVCDWRPFLRPSIPSTTNLKRVLLCMNHCQPLPATINHEPIISVCLFPSLLGKNTSRVALTYTWGNSNSHVCIQVLVHSHIITVVYLQVSEENFVWVRLLLASKEPLLVT